MFKKPIFLFIATFVLAIVLAFFSSYFIVREVRGVTLGNVINMGTNKIINLKGAEGEGSDAVNLGQYKSDFALCLKRGGPNPGSDDVYCITTWCDLNDFELCNQDDFYPWGDKPPPCFTAKTPILMADGKYKNIADIQSGEYVLTRESEDSPKLVKAKVLDTYEHWDNRYLVINGSLEVTSHHRMFVNGEWKTAGKIKLGDKLLNKDNQEVVVESLQKRIKEERFKVYNLEIEKYKTYIAGGFYVHNMKELLP
jgi:hypothetical protein